MVRGQLFLTVMLPFLVVTCLSSKSGRGSAEKPMSRHPLSAFAPNHQPVPLLLDCDNVNFWLATREDPAGTTMACLEQKTTLFNGKLDVAKPTKILVHGWINTRKTFFTENLTMAYLKAEDVNVIQVEWGEEAETDYFTAAYRSPQVGYTVAQFIMKMVRELNLDVNNVYLLGFSMGAQIAGIAGYYTSPKLARVIGLDPSGPFFESKGPSGRITPESGQFVITVASCKHRLGTSLDSGHLNFYVNSGMCQPGCFEEEYGDIVGYCAHNRAPKVLLSSLSHPNGFLATKCDNYLEYELGICDNRPTAYFVENVDTSTRGIYYFQTSSTFPYTVKNRTNVRMGVDPKLPRMSFRTAFNFKEEETFRRIRHFSNGLGQILRTRDHPHMIKAFFQGTYIPQYSEN